MGCAICIASELGQGQPLQGMRRLDAEPDWARICVLAGLQASCAHGNLRCNITGPDGQHEMLCGAAYHFMALGV